MILAEKQNQDRLDRQIQQYRSELDFKMCHWTSTKKKYWHLWWEQELQVFCKIMRASNAFLERELELLNTCDKTFGSWEIYYMPPGRKDVKKGNTTSNKRENMMRKLKKFQMVQARSVLQMLKSGGSRWGLSVTLDTLITKYDNDIRCQGCVSSGLH